MGFNRVAYDASLTLYLCTKYWGELRPDPNGETIPEMIPLDHFYRLHETGPNQAQAVYRAEIAISNGRTENF